MFGRPIRIGSIAGIRIAIHQSWLLIVVILTSLLALSVFPGFYNDWPAITCWLVGGIASILLFLTVLIHALAHVLVAFRNGLAVPDITLVGFGGISHLSKPPKTARQEFQIAAAGPGVSLLLGGLLVLSWFFSQGGNEQITAVLAYLGVANLLLAVFNSLPGFPLAGGRLLHSIAWKVTNSFRRATRISSRITLVFSWGLIIGGGVVIFVGWLGSGIWAILVGWFLLRSSRHELRTLQIAGVNELVTAENVMKKDFSTAIPGTPISQIVEMMVANSTNVIVVALDQRVLGLITEREVRFMSSGDRLQSSAQSVMKSRDDVIAVESNTSALEVLNILENNRVSELVVLHEGQLVGLIEKQHFFDRIKNLGLGESQSTTDFLKGV
jgi:Zn-dependent protease/CBS domain-containing protein